MSKLRAIGQWIWLNKERMFLLVMLVILVWRVYMVMNPAKTEEKPIPMPKQAVDLNALAKEAKPGAPDSPPELPATWDWSSLWVRNPFTVYSDTSKQSGKGVEGKTDDIELLDIQKKGNAPQVKLRYGKAMKWHSVGDSFVSYKLLSIDVEGKSCEVYSENKGRSITLKARK